MLSFNWLVNLPGSIHGAAMFYDFVVVACFVFVCKFYIQIITVFSWLTRPICRYGNLSSFSLVPSITGYLSPNSLWYFLMYYIIMCILFHRSTDRALIVEDTIFFLPLLFVFLYVETINHEKQETRWWKHFTFLSSFTK